MPKRRIGFRSFQDDEEEEEDKKDPKVDFSEHPVMTRFFQTYLPVATFKDATVFYETADLVRMLWDQGCGVGSEELTSWMIKNGYNQEILEGVKTVWLLKEIDF